MKQPEEMRAGVLVEADWQMDTCTLVAVLTAVGTGQLDVGNVRRAVLDGPGKEAVVMEGLKSQVGEV